MKPVRLRPAAQDDLEQVVRAAATAAGPGFGEETLRLALSALSSIESSPRTGQQWLGQHCDVPELRTHRTGHLALLWLYFESDDGIDVIRLLSERPEIPRLMHWAG